MYDPKYDPRYDPNNPEGETSLLTEDKQQYDFSAIHDAMEEGKANAKKMQKRWAIIGSIVAIAVALVFVLVILPMKYKSATPQRVMQMFFDAMVSGDEGDLGSVFDSYAEQKGYIADIRNGLSKSNIGLTNQFSLGEEKLNYRDTNVTSCSGVWHCSGEDIPFNVTLSESGVFSWRKYKIRTISFDFDPNREEKREEEIQQVTGDIKNLLTSMDYTLPMADIPSTLTVENLKNGKAKSKKTIYDVSANKYKLKDGKEVSYADAFDLIKTPEKFSDGEFTNFVYDGIMILSYLDQSSKINYKKVYKSFFDLSDEEVKNLTCVETMDEVNRKDRIFYALKDDDRTNRAENVLYAFDDDKYRDIYYGQISLQKVGRDKDDINLLKFSETDMVNLLMDMNIAIQDESIGELRNLFGVEPKDIFTALIYMMTENEQDMKKVIEVWLRNTEGDKFNTLLQERYAILKGYKKDASLESPTDAITGQVVSGNNTDPGIIKDAEAAKNMYDGMQKVLMDEELFDKAYESFKSDGRIVMTAKPNSPFHDDDDKGRTINGAGSIVDSYIGGKTAKFSGSYNRVDPEYWGIFFNGQDVIVYALKVNQSGKDLQHSSFYAWELYPKQSRAWKELYEDDMTGAIIVHDDGSTEEY